MPDHRCRTNPCHDLTRYGGRSYDMGGRRIHEVTMSRPGYATGAIMFDMSTIEGKEAYFAHLRRTWPERLRGVQCDALRREARTWFGVDRQGVVRGQTLPPGCRPQGGDGVVWLGAGREAREAAFARTRGDVYVPASERRPAPSPCGITGWELRAREKERAAAREAQAKADKQAADRAWLQETLAKTAQANAAAVQSGVMQERRAPGLVTRVRLPNGGQVPAALGDEVATLAPALLAFLRSDTMTKLLAGKPLRRYQGPAARSTVSAYRSITSPADAVATAGAGAGAQGWFELHELTLGLAGDVVSIRYHSHDYATSVSALRARGENQAADALAALERLGVAVQLEPV